MTRPLPLAIAAIGALLSGCGLSQQGVEPRRDTIAFPASATTDPDGRWLFVANSNADLRYNDGTLVALDLELAAVDRTLDVRATFPECPNANYKDPDPLSDPPTFCCRDALDPVIINCDERRYITHPDRTVRIGSFAAGMVWQRPSSISNPGCEGSGETPGLGAPVDRILVAVRGDTSLTWINVDRERVEPDNGDPDAPWSPRLHCGEGDDFQLCDEHHQSTESLNGVRLPDEPYTLALDPGVGLLYLGHLSGDPAHAGTGGISLFDLTATSPDEGPAYLGPSGPIFGPNSSGLYGVTSLTPRRNGNSFDVYATSRFVPQTTGVRTTAFCPAANGQTYANLVVIGAGGSFNPNIGGSEIRGIQFPSVPTGQEAFVLQRSPPALVGFNGGNPTSFLETCTSPTFLYRHNAGHAGEKLFVNCSADGQIWVFDPAVPRLVAILSIGRAPAGIVFEPAPDDDDDAGEHYGTTAYVVGFGDNNISVVDLTPGSDTEYRVVHRLGFPRVSPR
jgi:hypothetical protein